MSGDTQEQRNALERIRDIKRSVHPRMWNPAAALEECIRIAREALDAPAVPEPALRRMAANTERKLTGGGYHASEHDENGWCKSWKCQPPA